MAELVDAHGLGPCARRCLAGLTFGYKFSYIVNSDGPSITLDTLITYSDKTVQTVSAIMNLNKIPETPTIPLRKRNVRKNIRVIPTV